MAEFSQTNCHKYHVLLGLLFNASLVACSGQDEPQLPNERTVAVTEVQSVAATQRRYPGTLRAVDRSDLAFEVGGPVSSMNVELGDSIEPGQLLATIDPTPFRLALDASQANLNNARAELTDAEQDFARRESLLGTGAVSQSSIDQASARLERARSQVAARQAEVASAEDQLSDANLLAPFAGRVAARLAEPYQVVAAGAPVLRVIDEGSAIEAVISVSGAVRRELNNGQTVTLEHNSSGTSALGQIVEIGAEANRAGMFPVIVQIDADASAFIPGESIEASFIMGNAADAVNVPITAFVTHTDGNTWVYVIDNENGTRVTQREVEITDLADEGAIVSSGLNAGELIVVRGVDLLEDGQSVSISGAGTARYIQ
ncbi:MAG: efflux RND transporter periplasmic adaptor subunit [Gammaproteobacteria bacterium]